MLSTIAWGNCAIRLHHHQIQPPSPYPPKRNLPFQFKYAAPLTVFIQARPGQADGGDLAGLEGRALVHGALAPEAGQRGAVSPQHGGLLQVLVQLAVHAHVRLVHRLQRGVGWQGAVLMGVGVGGRRLAVGVTVTGQGLRYAGGVSLAHITARVKAFRGDSGHRLGVGSGVTLRWLERPLPPACSAAVFGDQVPLSKLCPQQRGAREKRGLGAQLPPSLW